VIVVSVVDGSCRLYTKRSTKAVTLQTSGVGIITSVSAHNYTDARSARAHNAHAFQLQLNYL
jgi:hypothetical protein